ncbi:MAG: small conductance mechanosensitive channel [Verrucomicrobiota bacterium]|jgi:ABC-type antimicrobial peptide transport system permease subunit|nr:small conductance mechanosensitive channel [Verrucomicrobiota bacterium]MDK2962715.1 small conductance mechanosensitive channel [Verrucomicrobiota bacterium]
MLTTFGVKSIAVALIFIIGRWAAMLVEKPVHKMTERSKADLAIIGFTCGLVQTALLVSQCFAAVSLTAFPAIGKN